MRKTSRLVLLAIAIAAPLHAQSLAELSEAAKKIHHDWPLSTNVGAPPEPALTPAELAALDRSQFDKVHAAAQAARDSLMLEGVAGKTEAVRTMREFKTAAGLAAEKAVTKAEKFVAGHYVSAQFWLELSQSAFDGARGTSGETFKKMLEQSNTSREKGLADLTAADTIYLPKREPR